MTSPIAAQISAVKAELASRPDGLVAHTGRVLHEALELAARWDLDPERVELAAWGHDLYRAHAPGELLRLSREAGLPISAADEAGPVMLHGPLAASAMWERFSVRDEDVLAAVRVHTAGTAEMPLIARVLLIADKVEKRKRARRPAMAAVRRAARRDLDLALLCWADWKWVEERERGWESYPAHWTARQQWVRQHHIDADGSPARRPR